MPALLIAALIGLFVQQQPTFRSRVELIRLDVGVVDKDGRPVRDLRAEDFVVRVDGAERRVSFAHFYGADDGPRAVQGDAPVAVASNASAVPGRVVVLVADLESVTQGNEKPIFDTAAGLIDRLAPSDAAGLLALSGRSVELTRDHRKVREALEGLRGFAPSPTSRYRMSVREAEAFRSGDTRIIGEVVERECRPSDTMCPRELGDQAMPLLMEADRRSQGLVAALTSLFERLEPIDAPKSVVLLSGGLQRRQGSAGWFSDLERRSRSAGISMSILQVEQAENDASRRGPGGTLSRADLTDGLSAIAGATGAEMYFGIGRATGALDRIRSEIVNSYQLGVESLPSDAGDRKHRLTVEVRRNGVTVRARKELVVSGTPRAASNPVDLLAQPIDFTELPLTVATFTTRGEEPSTLKVIVLVEVSAGAAEAAGGSYAFSIAAAPAKPVFETADRLAAGSPASAVAAQVPPGRYRLRAAAVDTAGRQGSLDMPIVVGLRQVGALQFSDLIVGRLEGAFTPATRVPPGVPLVSVLELYSADPSQLEGLDVSVELRRAGGPTEPTLVPAEVRKTSLDRRRIANANIPATSLGSGTWLISAVVRRGSEVLGQITRGISVSPPVGGDQLK